MSARCPSCLGSDCDPDGLGRCRYCGTALREQAPEPDAWAITADTLENLEPLVTLLTGLRAKLLAEGFSPDAADALVVEASRVMTAQQELHTRTLAAKRAARMTVRGNGYLTSQQAEHMLARIELEAQR